MEWYQAVNLETEGRCFLVHTDSCSGVCSELFHLEHVPIPCDVCMHNGSKKCWLPWWEKGRLLVQPTGWPSRLHISNSISSTALVVQLLVSIS